MQIFQNIKKILTNQKAFIPFIALAFLLFGLMCITKILSGKFEANDFRVMYSAAEHFWNNQQVYNVSYGLDTGYYKYSPVVLLFFLPSLLFSFFSASFLHFILTFLVLILLFQTLLAFFKENYSLKFTKTNLLLIVILAAISGHLIREFHLGNINLFLLFLAISSLRFITQGKIRLPSLFFAIIVLTKPYLVLLALPILLFGYYRIFWWTIVWAFGFILVSLPVIGVSHFVPLYTDWFQSILAHSEYLISNNTLFHGIEMFSGKNISAQLGIPSYVIFSSVLFIYFKNKTLKSTSNATKYMTLFAFTLLGIFPNFLVTDTEHFLFSLPMLFFLVIQLFQKKSIWLWAAFIVLIFFYLGETNLFLGKEIANQIKIYGGMGFANLLLISWSFVLNLTFISQFPDQQSAVLKT
jgi:hypothetical protein